MKRIVLTFGLVSGIVMSAMLAVTVPFQTSIDPSRGMLIGYATMVAASLAIYFGVRRYRDEQPSGSVGFGRALVVGLLIAGIAATCYTVTWELIYFKLAPDFATRYRAHMIDAAGGTTPAEVAAKRAEMARFVERYDGVAFNAAITFLEPLPVGILVALISAATLRRATVNERMA